MKIFGLEISRAKAAVPANLTSPADRGNWWWPVVREPFTGAWQQNRELSRETILAYSAVYACVSLIASDIAKMGLRLVEQDDDGIWAPVNVAAFSPVLRKPNPYQNRIKFIEQWVVSKLLHGNTYVYKERDARNIVVAMYVLDPLRTKPLIADDGSVYYQLSKDNLSGINEVDLRVPASEIIHDRMTCLYHPLVGVSPLTACAVAASQGLTIQNQSEQFFRNGSRPSGILSAAGRIDEANAKRLKEAWEQNYSGGNSGRIAILGDGLTYQAMTMTASDAQLIEQLKWTAEQVCTCFHVPPFKIGVGPMPAYNNIEALNIQYYAQALQELVELIELSLDEGLGLNVVPGHVYGTEFDLSDLLRMDTATRIKTYSEGVRGGIFKPNEARALFDLPPVEGGDEVYLQQQNYSLPALAKRDAKDDPFSNAAPAAPAAAPPNGEDNQDTDEEEDDEEGEDDDTEALSFRAGWELKMRLMHSNP